MPEHIRQEPKVLVSTENLTEQEWLAYRRRGIGGSDVAAILGISPFRTARDLYDDKLNIALAVDDAGNWVALEMGHLLEPLVAQIFTKKTGLEVFQMDDAAGKYRLNVSILQPSAPSTDVDAKSSKFITCVASQSTMPSKMPKGVHLLAAIPRRFTDSKCRPGRTA